MSYPPEMVEPMREELTRLGVKELRTPEEVDALLQASSGTSLVFVNSVCGCAAGTARPGLAEALGHSVRPDVVATVFAGVDQSATARLRSYFPEYPPSSPQVALFRDGKLVRDSAVQDRLVASEVLKSLPTAEQQAAEDAEEETQRLAKADTKS